jgi:hypothetical protein
MLSVNDLIDINYIPLKSDISLQLLIDFYEQYLCRQIFIFSLRNGEVIKLFFRDATEIFHISGIDHIYEGTPMNGTRFLEEVKNGKIDFSVLKTVNVNAYKDYEIRIRSMACLDTIIKNCEYLWYPSGKIPNSAIEVKYLLLKGLDGKNIHLGIDSYKENRPYFSRTLLVTEGNTIDKFVRKADEKLRVSKLEIRDKDTDNALLCIDRERAEQIAMEKVRIYADKWFANDFPILIFDYLVKNNNKSVLEMWLQNISEETLNQIGKLYDDIEFVLQMRSETVNLHEWRDLLFEVLGNVLKDSNCIKNVLILTMINFNEYQEVFKNSIKRTVRSGWKASLRKNNEANKVSFKNRIDNLDFYWSGKIVAEVIRKYDKEEADANIASHIDEYILSRGPQVITSILVNEICEQPDYILNELIQKVCDSVKKRGL